MMIKSVWHCVNPPLECHVLFEWPLVSYFMLLSLLLISYKNTTWLRVSSIVHLHNNNEFKNVRVSDLFKILINDNTKNNSIRCSSALFINSWNLSPKLKFQSVFQKSLGTFTVVSRIYLFFEKKLEMNESKTDVCCLHLSYNFVIS
jgi:hypothetical protein